MKQLKYVLVGALMLGINAPVMAQEDNKSVIESITKVIKSNSSDAEEQVKAVFKKNKKNPEVLVGIARAYFEQKDTAKARVFADFANKAAKYKCAQAYVLLGDISAMGEDGGTAAQHYQQAISFDPKNPEPYYKYANVYRKVSPTVAVMKLDELRKQRPDVAVDALAGRIYYMSNEFDKAITSYKKADISKMEERDITEYAMALYFKQRNQESLEVVQYGLKKKPRDAAFNRLAFFNSTDLKNYDQALLYADALFNKSDSAKFSYFDYTYYGNALNGAKKYDEAIDMFKKALEQEFDSKDKKAGVIKTLSDAYSSQEKYEDAIKYYEEYLNTYSTPTATDYAGLPQLYYYKASKEQGDAMKASLKKSDELYGQLAEKYQDAIEYATFWRARVNNAMDNEQKEALAKPYYEKLIEVYSTRNELNNSDKARLKESYLYLISYYARVVDDMTKAKECATKLLEIDPENETAKVVLGVK
ncbi:MAG: tetratricopeptide repeat protein [Prevotella sp.]|nr:tetratricopeptide repeat protein [Prevotella sp.]MDY4499672.1 tetratricopeptide repeat protein [Prevotella sp.]